jgi:hypothetical protein
MYADTDATVPGMLGELAMQRRARAQNEGAVEVLALNTELVKTRGQVQRYQSCLAMLAKFDRRNRDALAKALHELKVSRTQAADYLEQLKCGLSRRYVGSSRADQSDAGLDIRNGYRRQWQARLPLAISLATLALSIGASPVR